jgi:phosphoribosylglycinamide formyltransferase-1
MKLNIAVFGSGRGSNFNSVLNAIMEGKLESNINVVISNNSKAGILEIARNKKIPAFHISSKTEKSEQELNLKIIKTLEDHNVDFILLAGYMKKIDFSIISKYKNRIINIHPSLIPSFCGDKMYGENVHKAVLDYGCKVTGVTVHFVDEEYDHGAIILQQAVEVFDNDDTKTLATRVLETEHKIIVDAIKLFENEKITLSGRRVIRKN